MSSAAGMPGAIAVRSCGVQRAAVYKRRRPEIIRMPTRERAAAMHVSRVQNMRTFLEFIVLHPKFTRYLASIALLRLGMALPDGLFSVFWINKLQAQDSMVGSLGLVA